MEKFLKEELKMAERSITSTLRKNEKVYETLSHKENPRAFQLQRVAETIQNFRVMLALVENALAGDDMNLCSTEDMEQVREAIPYYIEQIEKVKPKFKEGTPQYTLAVRRIDAYFLALKLIENELRAKSEG